MMTIQLKSKFFIAGLILVFATLSLVSCGKKWKKTTQVTFNFLMTKDSIHLDDDDVLYFYEGSMIIGEMDFFGSREQGVPVNFSNQLKTVPTANLADGTTTSSIRYDIPQGIYENINLSIKAVNKDTVSSIILNGVFYDRGDDNKNTHVIFELDAEQIFNTKAIDKSGKNKIVLTEGTPAKCNITLNVNYWFATLTEKMFEKSDTYFVNGEETIIVSKEKNQDIYNLISQRIMQSTTKAVFQ